VKIGVVSIEMIVNGAFPQFVKFTGSEVGLPLTLANRYNEAWSAQTVGDGVERSNFVTNAWEGSVLGGGETMLVWRAPGVVGKSTSKVTPVMYAACAEARESKAIPAACVLVDPEKKVEKRIPEPAALSSVT
jgi:hypothetical protein